MDAIVTVGEVPLPDDPLYPYINGHPTALLKIAGQPMVQWVLDALSGANGVDRILLVGLNEKSGLTSKKPITYVSNQGRWFENLRTGAAELKAIDRQARYAMLVSADLPGLRAEMVDLVIRDAQPRDEDVIVTLISRQVMEKRLPERKFTWARLQEGSFWGGALNLCRLDFLLDQENERWVKFLQGRKNPASLAGKLGIGTYFQYLFGRLSMEQATGRVKELLGLRIRALECPYAEVGMRVKDPEMLDYIEVELKKQVKKAAASAPKGKVEKKVAPAKKLTNVKASTKGKLIATSPSDEKIVSTKVGKRPKN